VKRIYIAGPIGPNDAGRMQRIHDAIYIANALWRYGCAPFVPHLAHWWDERHPAQYEEWMAYDAVWLRQCEAVYRMAGESPGADREVAWAVANGLPVFGSMEEAIAWAKR
jgi:hypothetical protein